MNLSQLLTELTLKKVILCVAGDQLLCRGPKQVLTPEMVSAIKEHKEKLMALAGQADANTLIYPLSYSQQSLWTLYNLAPHSTAYNINSIFTLNRNVDADLLQKTLNVLVDRHPILRTTYGAVEGEPLQLIRESCTINIEHLDAGTWSAEKTAQWITWELDRPFDLENGPVLRVTLLTDCPYYNGPFNYLDDRFASADDTDSDGEALSESTQNNGAEKSDARDPILILNVHHIAMDHWSLMTFFQELSSLYRALNNGEQSPLPELTCDYRDQVRWELERVRGERGQALLHFWRERLAGDLPVADLPVDNPYPAVQTFNGQKHMLLLDRKTSLALRGLAQAQGATPFVLLLTIFQLFIHRLTGQDDVIVGCPTSGRISGESQRILGDFVNSIAVRADLSENPGFIALLGQIKSAVFSSIEHQEYPFPLLVQKLNASGDPSRPPVFQVLFNWNQDPVASIKAAAGVEEALVKAFIGGSSTGATGATHDISLTVTEHTEKFRLGWIFNTDLFEPRSMERLMDIFLILVRAVLQEPANNIGGYPLYTEGERDALFAHWRGRQVPQNENTLIHTLIAQQASKHPRKIALRFLDAQLSYGKLDCLSNQLASYFHSLGISAGSRVGICLDRSLDMVLALVATLKAGAAYIPLDPTYPHERLAYILEDAGLDLLISRRDLVDIELANRCKTLDTSGESSLWQKVARMSDEDLPPQCRGEDPAYIIYTSGSTGKPKGVCISHNNVVNFFSGMDDGAAPGVWLAVTSISFDISVLELFWTLSRGYEVVMQPDQPLAEENVVTAGEKVIGFSLYYFAADQQVNMADKYRLLLEGARFADRHNFDSIWIPERHFHDFGGAYPNPSVAASAIAAITEKLNIRAGSVVLPLHDPIRVAEEWSMVDNLSRGRVGLSFASGWQPNDFVLAPEHFQDRRERMLQGIEQVLQLWRGEALERKNGVGENIEVRLHPSPIRKELPIWVTAAGSPETFRSAGAIGANLLTHLLGQNIRELTEKIALYRAARREAGHDPDTGRVTIMLHTFVGHDLEQVRETVKEPFKNYLKTSLNLFKPVLDVGGEDLDPAAHAELLAEQAFNRYFGTSALLGTVDSCLELVEQLRRAGVDEIACLIDFGVAEDEVLASLPLLDRLRDYANLGAGDKSAEDSALQQRRQTINQRFQRQYVPPYTLIESRGVTHLQCTPSYAQMLLEQPEGKAALGKLRKLLVGGEALPRQLAAKLLDTGVGTLLNMYGPTEATVWCSVQNVSEGGAEGSANNTVFLGNPICNTQFYILDKYLQPVPPGVAGELHVGGLNVSSGYVNRPALTAERFIDNPFAAADASCAKLYKTGDLVRINHRGQLEFVGRIDNQVKIRGHRIEIGEIEAALAKHPRVAQAVVVASGENENTQLIAYVVPQPGQNLVSVELKEHLRLCLPPYMLPNVFIVLEAFPLTPNGKIDRKALPAPRQGAIKKAYLASRNSGEKNMADIWQEVLNLPTIGVYDNFFDLGGHSLMAIQLISRIRTVFGVEAAVTGVFEHPVLEDFARWVESLPTSKRVAVDYPVIEPVDRTRPLPLSYAQLRLWFLDQYENNHTPAYNIPVVLSLTGKLNTAVLRESFATVIRRYESLRTIIVLEQGEPRQQVLAEPPLDFKITEVSAAEADAAIKREIHRPFDLSAGPLIRIRLLKAGPQQYFLSIVQHHIIGDGWSTGILIRELAASYKALYHQRQPELPPVPLQYGDFTVWQRQWLQGDVLEEKLAYWRPLLKDLPTLQLPADFQRPNQLTYTGRSAFFLVDQDLIAPLHKLARQTRGTLFTTLFAAFNVLIARYCGAEDVVIGTPVANRMSQQLESIFGLFVNMLVMRNNLAGNPRFDELLERVANNAFAAFAHQDMPFEQLVNSLQLQRDPSRSPLFQVMFTLENENEEIRLGLPELKESMANIEYEVAKYDLSLILRHTSQGLIGTLEYNRDLFRPETIERIGRHYNNLLRELVKNPQVPVQEVCLLSREEQHQRVAWNSTQQALAEQDLCIHELFIKRALETPAATAVIAPDRQLSYGELLRKAFALSRQLRAAGAQPNQLVAVMMPKGWQQVVAVLGVLMAGSAYLPVDDRWPEQRRREILELGEANIIVTDVAWPAAENPFPALKNIAVNDLSEAGDTDLQTLSSELPRVPPADLAYVIFTSGSTGKPKGVVMDHQGVVNTLLDINQRFQVTAADRVFALSELSFDLSVYDIFGLLAAGASMVFPAPEKTMDARHWAALMQQHGITLWNSVPALMQLLVDYLDEQQGMQNSRLRLALLSGDWLPVNLPARMQSHFDVIQVVSLGGATEAAIWSIHYPITQVEPQWGSIPYGKPLANQKFYVLNDYFQPCPIGVVGNLFIAGKGLARGYWKDEARTQASFVSHPITGERLYKTGDLGRYYADGNIEFIGRVDFQVKVNGYRIELGEIEARLATHPNVNTAIAVIQKNAFGVNRIVCFYLPENIALEQQKQKEHQAQGNSSERDFSALVLTAADDAEVEAENLQLREYLEELLPAYMVPSTFIRLPALPLTANGKVDRTQLPEVEQHSSLRHNFVAPRSATEQKIAAIWQQVLQLQQVGSRDNYFEIGGDSLSIVKVHRLLAQAFEQQDILIVDLFRHPTIHALASYLDKGQEQSIDAETILESSQKRKSARRKRKDKLVV